MFDAFAKNLIAQLPELPELDHVACRRALSRAYLLVVQGRIASAADHVPRPDTAALRLELLRMANALESVAVFDPLNGLLIADSTLSASAFVAAEALSLLEEISRGEPNPLAAGPITAALQDPLQDPVQYALIESALLYMVGGYDINAAAAVSRVREPALPVGTTAADLRNRSGARLFRRVVALCRGDVSVVGGDVPHPMGEQPPLLDELSDDTRTHLYEALCAAVDHFRSWLGGEGEVQAATDTIARVRKACSPSGGASASTPRVSAFADVYHLASLLAAAIGATRARSVVHVVPHPTVGDATLRAQFPAYLAARARGTPRLRGRPLLWPSTLEFVRDCLPGPHRDAVVSMPTGSGKSFLAELAVAHALTRGWVLYLAPTNALAHQIRRDLGRALAPFSEVKVAAFVGGAEYTALSDEDLEVGAFVGVMTPEKCALALRLYPETFANCSLCVCSTSVTSSTT